MVTTSGSRSGFQTGVTGFLPQYLNKVLLDRNRTDQLSDSSYPGVNPVVPNPYREGRLDKAEIRTALHNWQMGLMAPEKRQVFNWNGRCSGDGKSTGSGVSASQTTSPGAPPPNRGKSFSFFLFFVYFSYKKYFVKLKQEFIMCQSII